MVTELPTPVHDLRTDTLQFETIFETLSLDADGIGRSLLKILERFHKRAGKVVRFQDRFISPPDDGWL